jgi:hypothetical protein
MVSCEGLARKLFVAEDDVFRKAHDEAGTFSASIFASTVPLHSAMLTDLGAGIIHFFLRFAATDGLPRDALIPLARASPGKGTGTGSLKTKGKATILDSSVSRHVASRSRCVLTSLPPHDDCDVKLVLTLRLHARVTCDMQALVASFLQPLRDTGVAMDAFSAATTDLNRFVCGTARPDQLDTLLETVFPSSRRGDAAAAAQSAEGPGSQATPSGSSKRRGDDIGAAPGASGLKKSRTHKPPSQAAHGDDDALRLAAAVDPEAAFRLDLDSDVEDFGVVDGGVGTVVDVVAGDVGVDFHMKPRDSAAGQVQPGSSSAGHVRDSDAGGGASAAAPAIVPIGG